VTAVSYGAIASTSSDVRTVAQSLGYRLTNNGRRLDACPSCGPTTAIQVNTDFFKCHRCNAGGRVHSFVAYHLFDQPWRQLTSSEKKQARTLVHLPQAALPSPRPPSQPSTRWLRADTFWSTFERSGPLQPNADARRWLTQRLAGDAALADGLLHAHPPLLAAPGQQDPIRQWWDSRYAVAVPLYVWDGPQKGRVADLKPRWCGPGPAPRGLKEPNLSSKKTRASGLARFFGSPDRVTWAVHTVVICEGGADVMVAEAMRHGGLLPPGSVVVGIPGAGQGPAFGRCLAQHLTQLTERYEGVAGPRPAWHVIVATDADAAGQQAADAIHTELRTRAAPVRVFRPRWPDGHDLGDRVAEVGATAAAQELVEAGAYQPPAVAGVPHIYQEGADRLVALEDAGPVLEDTLRELVCDAQASKTRHVLAVPPGAGKTSAALNLVVARAGGTTTIPPLIIALPNWASVAEKRAQLVAMAEAAGVAVTADELVGVSEGCQDAIHDGYPVRARTAYEAAGHPLGWRRDVCPACPLRPTCRAHHRPSKTSDVIFTVHAMLTRLKADDFKRFVVVTDEAAEPVQLSQFGIEHLRAPDDATLGETWEMEQLDAVDRLDAWRDLRDLVSDVLAKSDRGRHAQHLSGPKLNQALLGAARARGGEPAATRLKRRVVDAAGVDPADLPAPDTYQLLRTGRADSRILVRRDLPTLYQALEAVLHGRQPEPGMPHLHLVVPPVGSAAARAVSFELRHPTPLPEGLGAVALDATAALTPHLHEAYLGDVTMTRVAVRPDPEARIVRVFMPQKGLSRSRLLPYGTPGKEALTRLTRLLHQVQAHSGVFAGDTWKPERAALLTYRPLVTALERDDAPTGPLASWSKAVRRLARKSVSWGYYGGNARASNAFEGADLLVTVGDPWPNLGARRATLEALGLTDDVIAEALQGEVDAELSQAHGRSRAERRAGVTVQVHVGSRMPACWRGLPVHTIESRDPRRGRPDSAQTVRFEAALVDLAEQFKALTSGLVNQLLGEAARSDIKPSVSLLAEQGTTRESSVLLAAVAAAAGLEPAPLPPPTTRRRLLKRVLGELGWRQSGRIWLAPEVSESEGDALISYLQACTKGRVPRPPDAARHHWWWLAAVIEGHLEELAEVESAVVVGAPVEERIGAGGGGEGFSGAENVGASRRLVITVAAGRSPPLEDST